MMKHKRPTSNYRAPCGPWGNEEEGPRKGFWSCLFIPGRMNYAVRGRVMKYKNRGESVFKNQRADSKDQEVVICVAQISTSLFLDTHKVQPHHWVIRQLPLSSRAISHLPSVFHENSGNPWVSRTQWMGKRSIFVCPSPLPHHHQESGEQEPVLYPLWVEESDSGRALVSLRGNVNKMTMTKKICPPSSISYSPSPTLSFSPIPRAPLKKTLLGKSNNHHPTKLIQGVLAHITTWGSECALGNMNSKRRAMQHLRSANTKRKIPYSAY